MHYRQTCMTDFSPLSILKQKIPLSNTGFPPEKKNGFLYIKCGFLSIRKQEILKSETMSIFLVKIMDLLYNIKLQFSYEKTCVCN